MSMLRIISLVIPVVLASVVSDPFDKTGGYSSGIDPANDLIPIDYKGVMSGINDLSEDASFRRYTLLNKLINNEPKLRVATTNMYAQLTNMYKFLKGKQQGVDNITQVIDADASAGGIRATASDLRDQIPQASKMLRKMMDTLFKNLATDASSINRTLADTEEDYVARIKRAGETVSGLLKSMDSQFALNAYAQANAMKRSAAMLQSSFKGEIQGTQQSVNDVLRSISAIANKTKASSARMNLGLADAVEMSLNVESSHQTALSRVTDQIRQLVNSQQDKAQKTIGAESEKAVAKVESSGMKVAQSVERALNNIQTQLLTNITQIESNASKVSKQLSQDLSRWNQKMMSSLRSVDNDVKSNLTSIQSDSEKVQVDSGQFAMDSKNLLNGVDVSAKQARSDFVLDANKLSQAIPSHMQGIVAETARIASSINSDVAGSLRNENSGIASILDTASSISENIQSSISRPMSDFKQRLSDTSYRAGSNMKEASSLVDQNKRIIGESVNMAMNEHNDRLASLDVLMKSSIGDLSNTVNETRASRMESMNEIQSSLSQKSAQGYAEILDQLRGVSSDADDSLTEFITSVVGPNGQRVDEDLGQLSSRLISLYNSRQVLEDNQNSIWKSSDSGHMRRLSTMRNLGSQINENWDRNGVLIEGIKVNASEALSGLKKFIRTSSSDELARNKDYARSSIGMIRKILEDSIVHFWGNENTTGSAVADIASKVDTAQTLLSALSGESSQSISKIGSLILSLGSQIDGERKMDLQTSSRDVKRYQRDLFESLKGRIKAEADMGLAEVMATANSNKNRSSVLGILAGKLKSHMATIEQDVTTATNVVDNRASEAGMNISRVGAQINGIRQDMESSLKSVEERIGLAISRKSESLNATENELNGRLVHLKSSIDQSTETLQKNLLQYQTKIESIVAQIKKYMNISSSTDELAIQKEVARELSMVNKSAVEFAVMRSSIEERSDRMTKRRLNQTIANRDMIGNLINAAESVAIEKQKSTESIRQKLVSVGRGVDAQSSAVREVLNTESQTIDRTIAETRRSNEDKMKSLRGAQSKRYSQIEDRSHDLAEKARKDYLGLLAKTGGLDDDIALTARQLGEVLGGSKGRISDISTTVMNHMNVAASTLANLNSEKNRRIASIGDVMGIFSSVITAFVSEIQSGMRTMMSDVKSIDSWTSKKMKEIRTRSDDELGWLRSGIDRVKHRFDIERENEKATQQSLMAGLIDNKEKILGIEQTYKDQANTIKKRIGEISESVKSFGPRELNRVRSWINDRRRRNVNK